MESGGGMAQNNSAFWMRSGRVVGRRNPKRFSQPTHASIAQGGKRRVARVSLIVASRVSWVGWLVGSFIGTGNFLESTGEFSRDPSGRWSK
jgi:hypothetical protein